MKGWRSMCLWSPPATTARHHLSRGSWLNRSEVHPPDAVKYLDQRVSGFQVPQGGPTSFVLPPVQIGVYLIERSPNPRRVLHGEIRRGMPWSPFRIQVCAEDREVVENGNQRWPLL